MTTPQRISLALVIPKQFAITSNLRLGRFDRAKRVSILRSAAATEWHRALKKGIAPMQAAHATCYLTFSDRRRRDPNNWADTAKALIDGLVDGPKKGTPGWIGILPDDDSRHLVGPDMRVTEQEKHLGKDHLRVLLTFEPLRITDTVSIADLLKEIA